MKEFKIFNKDLKYIANTGYSNTGHTNVGHTNTGILKSEQQLQQKLKKIK